MSNAIDAHLTDEVINAAFENTNFGRTDFRTIMAETVMKRAAGYNSGRTRYGSPSDGRRRVGEF